MTIGTPILVIGQVLAVEGCHMRGIPDELDGEWSSRLVEAIGTGLIEDRFQDQPSVPFPDADQLTCGWGAIAVSRLARDRPVLVVETTQERGMSHSRTGPGDHQHDSGDGYGTDPASQCSDKRS